MEFDAGCWGMVEARALRRGEGWEAASADCGAGERVTWVNRGKRGCSRVRSVPPPGAASAECGRAAREEAARLAFAASVPEERKD